MSKIQESSSDDKLQTGSSVTGIKLEMIKKICVRDDDKILDIGCGDGSMLNELTKWRNAIGYGIDSSGDKIHDAQKQHENLHLVAGSIKDLSQYEDDTFRIITMCSSFHKIPNQQEYLHEIKRILAPGGRVYIGELALPAFFRVSSNVVGKVLPSKDGRYPSTYELLDMFKNVGLTKFRVTKKKRLLLISAKKEIES